MSADPRELYPPLEGEWELPELRELVAMQRQELGRMTARHSHEIIRLSIRLRKGR